MRRDQTIYRPDLYMTDREATRTREAEFIDKHKSKEEAKTKELGYKQVRVDSKTTILVPKDADPVKAAKEYKKKLTVIKTRNQYD